MIWAALGAAGLFLLGGAFLAMSCAVMAGRADRARTHSGKVRRSR